MGYYSAWSVQLIIIRTQKKMEPLEVSVKPSQSQRIRRQKKGKGDSFFVDVDAFKNQPPP